MELLRQKNVRLIAVNENVDSFGRMQEKINRMLVTEASRMEV